MAETGLPVGRSVLGYWCYAIKKKKGRRRRRRKQQTETHLLWMEIHGPCWDQSGLRRCGRLCMQENNLSWLLFMRTYTGRSIMSNIKVRVEWNKCGILDCTFTVPVSKDALCFFSSKGEAVTGRCARGKTSHEICWQLTERTRRSVGREISFFTSSLSHFDTSTQELMSTCRSWMGLFLIYTC